MDEEYLFDLASLIADVDQGYQFAKRRGIAGETPQQDNGASLADVPGIYPVYTSYIPGIYEVYTSYIPRTYLEYTSNIYFKF